MRTIGDQLSAVQDIGESFPAIKKLAVLPPKKPRPARGRPDDDPVAFLNPAKVNDHYRAVLDVVPIDMLDDPRLWDLGLIRHTIAHHGGKVRANDVDRFEHYDLRAGDRINPPSDFVAGEVQWVGEVGFKFLDRIQERVFSQVLPKLAPVDPAAPPPIMDELINIFGFLRKVVIDESRPPVQATADEVTAWYEQRNHELLESLRQECRLALINNYCRQ